MKKMVVVLVILTLLASNLACRALLPGTSQPGQYESICRESVSGVVALKENLKLPKHFREPHPTKQDGEFDPNSYFEVLTHLEMQDGLTLDYVYYQDGFGGLPLLYARPLDQPAYATDTDYYAVEPPTYLSSVVVDDSPEGYLQFVLLSVAAPQFYLDWHANYNDKQILCGASDLERVIGEHQDSQYYLDMTLTQTVKVRGISHPDPSIELRADRAIVTVLIFSNWGGFMRRTYTINRAFPHEIINIEDETLVEYNCGIMF